MSSEEPTYLPCVRCGNEQCETIEHDGRALCAECRSAVVCACAICRPDDAGKLYRMGGEWVCRPCDDRLTVGVGFGGGMPIGNWFPRMFPRLFGRREQVRREGTCETCGAAGWYLE
jgi:hypothetical protein